MNLTQQKIANEVPTNNCNLSDEVPSTRSENMSDPSEQEINHEQMPAIAHLNEPRQPLINPNPFGQRFNLNRLNFQQEVLDENFSKKQLFFFWILIIEAIYLWDMSSWQLWWIVAFIIFHRQDQQSSHKCLVIVNICTQILLFYWGFTIWSVEESSIRSVVFFIYLCLFLKQFLTLSLGVICGLCLCCTALGVAGCCLVVYAGLMKKQSKKKSQYQKKLEGSNTEMVQLTENTEISKEQCSICLVQETLDQRFLEIACHHKFHYQCIKKWTEEKNTCPICRFALY